MIHLPEGNVRSGPVAVVSDVERYADDAEGQHVVIVVRSRELVRDAVSALATGHGARRLARRRVAFAAEIIRFAHPRGDAGVLLAVFRARTRAHGRAVGRALRIAVRGNPVE